VRHHRHINTTPIRAFRNRIILSHITSVGSPRFRHRLYPHLFSLAKTIPPIMHRLYYSINRIGIFRLLFWAILNRWLNVLHLNMNFSKNQFKVRELRDFRDAKCDAGQDVKLIKNIARGLLKDYRCFNWSSYLWIFEKLCLISHFFISQTEQ